jgi:ABC-type sugar transport system substrate-binding protein
MAKFPGIAIVFRTEGPLSRERGVKHAEDALVANPDLKAIYTSNDDIALGAVQAVVAANRKGQTLVTGMNGVPPALRAVKDGGLALTVELNPLTWAGSASTSSATTSRAKSSRSRCSFRTS